MADEAVDLNGFLRSLVVASGAPAVGSLGITVTVRMSNEIEALEAENMALRRELEDLKGAQSSAQQIMKYILECNQLQGDLAEEKETNEALRKRLAGACKALKRAGLPFEKYMR